MTVRAREEEAHALDREDALAPLRERFHQPRQADGRPALYLCGNSLGLMPKGAEALVEAELAAWRERAVGGHFAPDAPWFSYHELLREPLARLVGAQAEEVVVMNGLTVNLHLMLISFYRPTRERPAIVIEANAFPSDRYAAESQLRLHGYDPAEHLLTLPLRPGETTHRPDDIARFLKEHGPRVATVMLGGVSYLSGQAFPLALITELAHEQGALCGFDLAHAAGNLELHLHDWGVDFAVWCGYKYLNAGPGGTAGCFVHERWANSPELPRLAGWWGNDPAVRFEMPEAFHPQPGAAGWQLSNCPILGTAPLRASLAVFEEAGGMGALRAKSVRLTGFLESLLDTLPAVAILTPREPAARGCQLSIRVPGGRATLEALKARGVVCDFRAPDVIRVAPVPLYNSFHDAWRFVTALEEALA